jgi:hypothetical protein
LESTQGAYNHEREAKGQNISVGNIETKSNGHRSRVEPKKLVETMRSLKMEVQRYRDENERIMRAQEDSNQINSQMMQSLNQLKR